MSHCFPHTHIHQTHDIQYMHHYLCKPTSGLYLRCSQFQCHLLKCPRCRSAFCADTECQFYWLAQVNAEEIPARSMQQLFCTLATRVCVQWHANIQPCQTKILKLYWCQVMQCKTDVHISSIDHHSIFKKYNKKNQCERTRSNVVAVAVGIVRRTYCLVKQSCVNHQQILHAHKHTHEYRQPNKQTMCERKEIDYENRISHIGECIHKICNKKTTRQILFVEWWCGVQRHVCSTCEYSHSLWRSLSTIYITRQ